MIAADYIASLCECTHCCGGLDPQNSKFSPEAKTSAERNGCRPRRCAPICRRNCTKPEATRASWSCRFDTSPSCSNTKSKSGNGYRKKKKIWSVGTQFLPNLRLENASTLHVSCSCGCDSKEKALMAFPVHLHALFGHFRLRLAGRQ